ncbi:MAG: hypothetical protein J1E43_09150 [Christensenellaceae bacterium]|nr:hypothetical protein [Christensenellaceae bacterium]
MPRYFQQEPEPEQQPFADDFAPDEDIPMELPDDSVYDQPHPEEIYLEDEDLLTDEEKAALRRERWRVLANLGDFIGVIAGTAVILVLIALIITLLHWVRSDITQSFTLWQTRM